MKAKSAFIAVLALLTFVWSLAAHSALPPVSLANRLPESPTPTSDFATSSSDSEFNIELATLRGTLRELAERYIPVFGVANFTSSLHQSPFYWGQGFATGILIDFGVDHFALETGGLAIGAPIYKPLSGHLNHVELLGLPVLAKYNFSGVPTESIFVKGGAMPYWPSGTHDIVNIMGILGTGFSYPIGGRFSVLVEGDYLRMLTAGKDYINYHGFSLMTGLIISD